MENKKTRILLHIVEFLAEVIIDITCLLVGIFYIEDIKIRFIFLIVVFMSVIVLQQLIRRYRKAARKDNID